MRTAQWKTWGEPPANGDMRQWQAGRCAWCGYEDDRLLRDHCHHTGLIRGLLCSACNNYEGSSFDPEWDAWRDGDNPASAMKRFVIYTDIYGQTPIHPNSALVYYSSPERRAWFEQIVSDLEAGGDWPAGAPWTDEATARKDAAMAQFHAAFDRLPSFAALAERIGGSAS